MVNAAPDGGATAGGQIRDVVRLRLPASGAYLSVLRSTTAGLAARLNFTLDEIEDLRIAVDEACAILVMSAVPGADLDSVFELSDGLMKISVSVLTLNGEQPDRDAFSWMVLAALAGEVASSVDADYRVTIELVKRRGDQGTPDGGVEPTSAAGVVTR